MRKGYITRENRTFEVKLDIPEEATEDEVVDYIKRAVRAYAGSLPLEDPMSGLDRDRVKVKLSYHTRYHRNKTNA